MRPLGLAALGLALLGAMLWAASSSGMAAWLMENQRAFHAGLAAQLRGLAAKSSATAAWGLATVSFLYGVFHAAGPGHGKAVVAAYLFTHESRLARGLWLAAASSLCQGVVAVAVVYGLIYLAGWVPRETRLAVAWSERLSFTLLATMGAVLAVGAARRLLALWRRPALAPVEAALSCRHGILPPPALVAATLATSGGWRASAGLVLSIGLRPCSGAVLVLALAKTLDLALAGVAAVLAMAVGTAATVALLAVLTVKARKWTLSMVLRDATAVQTTGDLLGLLGGVAIAAIALSLLAGSVAPAHPLGL